MENTENYRNCGENKQKIYRKCRNLKSHFFPAEKGKNKWENTKNMENIWKTRKLWESKTAFFSGRKRPKNTGKYGKYGKKYGKYGKIWKTWRKKI